MRVQPQLHQQVAAEVEIKSQVILAVKEVQVAAAVLAVQRSQAVKEMFHLLAPHKVLMAVQEVIHSEAEAAEEPVKPEV
jgi:hypothetical protein